VYRVQQKLGPVFRELEPYSLYPLDEYFGGTLRRVPLASADNIIEMPVDPAVPQLKIA